MHVIDAHIHTEGLSSYDLRLLALTGVRTIISFFKPYYRFSHVVSYKDRIERFLRVERSRVESVGIKTYLAIGISPTSGLRDPFSLIEYLESYLKYDVVVGIGESGLTDYNDPLQLETLKLQMELARRFRKPVFVDLPEENKKHALKRVEKLLDEVGLDVSFVVLTNITPLLALDLGDSGYWLSFSLYPEKPFVETLPENILRGDFPIDRVLLTSNLDAYSLDPLILPKALYELEVRGHYLPMLKKVMVENPKRLFGI
ncbi:MAG: hypothetical protein GXO39_02770 [Thermotogae bacterium]|nr:hypothetical protein [Thermotogota bacterium]